MYTFKNSDVTNEKFLCFGETKALFSLEKILVFATVALLFVYDKYYPIMD